MSKAKATQQGFAPIMARRSLGVSVVSAAFALGGCATNYPMMPTPVLYTGAQARPLFTQLPDNGRTPPLEVLYITDRAPATSPDDSSPYTAERSRSLAFGSTTVEFGDAITWDTLVAQSTSAKRAIPVALKRGPTQELGRFPRIPYRVTQTPAGSSRDVDVIAAHEAAKKTLQGEVERRLALAPRKEVVLYVHGYADTFDGAAFTMADVCHFLGREFVCIVFTWPAGGSSFLFGYNVDRESSEFATEDLKKAIRMIADTPGLQKIHLLAHSRGTDVLATAASDLSVEAYIGETTLGNRFKIGNIVLIAPDIDVDVAAVKIFKNVSDPDLPYGKTPRPGVAVPRSPGFHITVYVSPEDKALATSGWLFGSLARLGRFGASRLQPEQIEEIRELALFDVIQVKPTNCFICHNYFESDPRVSADLIALVRYGLKPNDPGRPLIEVARPFWRIPTNADTGPAE